VCVTLTHISLFYNRLYERQSWTVFSFFFRDVARAYLLHLKLILLCKLAAHVKNPYVHRFTHATTATCTIQLHMCNITVVLFVSSTAICINICTSVVLLWSNC
jgi:hypothetical protein